MSTKLQEKTLNLLLSGKHPSAKKYAGHHVLVVENKVFPLREDGNASEDIKKIKEKYGKSPIITFVPRQDISYILIACKK